MYKIFIKLLSFSLAVIKTLFKSKKDLIFENMVLRQQLAAYLAKKQRPRITDIDRSFWIAMKQIWPKWICNLLIVKPETVINWQKRRFKNYWRKKSLKNRKPGRLPIDKEIINLIKKMATENNWGAPRIYSELLMLGYDNVKQRTVSRYLKKFRSEYPDTKKRQSWITFLKNHREVILAMDFFIVPTVNFSILYVFFIIEHAQTEHPTAQWVMQQLREAFPFDSAPKYLIFDRDNIFSPQVKQLIKNMGIQPKLISYQTPWQNGVA